MMKNRRSNLIQLLRKLNLNDKLFLEIIIFLITFKHKLIHFVTFSIRLYPLAN